jgi:hypothetical protein
MLDKIRYRKEFAKLKKVHKQVDVNLLSGAQILAILNKKESYLTSETTGRKIKNLFLKYYG